jgi:hypothetical protein
MQNASSFAISSSSTTGSPVVQNDTAAAANLTAATHTFMRIEQLALDRQAWESTVYRTSNEMLYGLLQKCYQLYKDMEGSGEEAAKHRDALLVYVNLKGYAFLKTTHTISKIVKCVFSDNRSNDGADRRRVSAYSLVLRKALQENLPADQIPDFISGAGGVEAIRLGKKPSINALTPAQKVEQAKVTVAGKNVGIARGALLGATLDSGKIGSQVVLIGTWQADGTVTVQAVVESDSALKAALASYHTEHKATTEAKTQAAEQPAANDANAFSSAQQQAVAEALAA